MPVAERVVISPHLIKHVVRHRFGVGFEFGIIIVVEHRQLNPRGPDVTTTRSAGQLICGNCRDGDFALELSRGTGYLPGEVGIHLPTGIETGNPDSHQALVQGVVRGQEDNVGACPRGQLKTKAPLFPGLRLKGEF